MQRSLSEISVNASVRAHSAASVLVGYGRRRVSSPVATAIGSRGLDALRRVVVLHTSESDKILIHVDH